MNGQPGIYLDHAAATPTDSRVISAMRPFFVDKFANPSAIYSVGVETRQAVEKARISVANYLKTQPDTIYFTSGGTESNNLAILGAVRKQNKQNRQNKHIVTTAIEHHSVLEPMRQLEKEGCEVTFVPVNTHGFVAVEDIRKALKPETALLSVIYANNELGSIQPIADIGRMILQWRKMNGFSLPYFHVDACQATEYLPLEVDALHADLLTFNGSKVYGPKGIGLLYKRRGVEIEPIVFGGRQERGLRSGTENVPGIVGLGKAVEIVSAERQKEADRVRKLRDYFWNKMKTKLKGVELNGPSFISPSPRPAVRTVSPDVGRGDRGGRGRGLGECSYARLPNNLHVSFTGCDAEALILYLDAKGIACSAGSACSTDSDEISHVLTACGYDEARSKSSIRFTLGRGTTKASIDAVMKVLPKIVEMVRSTNTN